MYLHAKRLPVLICIALMLSSCGGKVVNLRAATASDCTRPLGFQLRQMTLLSDQSDGPDGKAEVQVIVVMTDGKSSSKWTYPSEGYVAASLEDTIEMGKYFPSLDANALEGDVIVYVLAVDTDEQSIFQQLGTDVVADLLINVIVDMIPGGGISKFVLGELASLGSDQLRQWVEDVDVIGQETFILSEGDNWSSGQINRILTTDKNLNIEYQVHLESSPSGTICASNALYNSKQIAFVSGETGNERIFTMNGDGSEKKPLTSAKFRSGYPVWSPDNKEICYFSDEEGNWNIYLMNADGTNVRQMTDNPARDGICAWSPDGSKILFNSQRDGNDEVYVMNHDGSNEINLTNSPHSEYIAADAWSSNSNNIVITSDKNGDENIYLMDPNGSNWVKLTDDWASESFAGWSYYGKRIMYLRSNGNERELYVMNADGGNKMQLLSFPASISALTWSPDGEKVLFSARTEPAVQIFSMNADATGIVQLTSGNYLSAAPSWQR